MKKKEIEERKVIEKATKLIAIKEKKVADIEARIRKA
ncbi:hypothetical protein BJF96_g10335 [Verticillium dahliae]|uniref:Uncharacterized protein n=1 Tax=Verticillium dahliae TaxID=27337 RepID=A0AA44W7V0_VERDA|nr:hypothetical protein BJF96_g10335 [Verticillium dahliae]